MHTYRLIEGKWHVGYWLFARWHGLSVHDSEGKAIERVALLNGGSH